MDSSKKYSLYILLGFGIIYAAISLVDHYLFRTFALDLGVYTNALYDYAHFQWNDSRTFKPIAENLLADHFDLYLIIFSPFSWIFKSYTLLIIQLITILLGGWGVYSYFSLEDKTKNLARWAMIWYLSFFGVFSALAFDYHSNVVAASILPWFFYFLKKDQLKQSLIIFVLILIAKENMPLWMAFVALGLAWEYRKMKVKRNTLLVLSGFSLFYFVAVTSWIMPAFANNDTYHHFHYSALGNNSKEAFLFLISHPLESLKILFTNHLQNPEADYLKLEFYIYLLITGFFILVRKPIYIFMLIPVFFQKMFHDNYIFWTQFGQYSIEFLPIMSIGIFDIISSINRKKWQKVLIFMVLIGNIAITFRIMDQPLLQFDRDRIRFYKANHYLREFDVKKLHEKFNEISPDAILSVHSPLMPHLSWRESVYQYPDVDNAEFIIISTHEEPYPLSQEQFDRKLDQIKSDSQWKIWYEEEGIYIFRRSE